MTRIGGLGWVFSCADSRNSRGKINAAVIDRRYSKGDESSGREEAGIGLHAKDRIARRRSLERMGRDREQFRALCQDSRLPAGESAPGRRRQTLSQGDPGGSHEEAGGKKLPGSDGP